MAQESCVPHRSQSHISSSLISLTLLIAAAASLGGCGERLPSPAEEDSAISSPFTKTTIDPAPPDTDHLEKAIGYFTSTSYLSYYLGTTNGGYIYDGQTNKRIKIDGDGFHYERARAFTYPGDRYAGVIASVNGQTIWYQNPANWNGGDATQTWGKQPLFASYCHDIRMADFDQDGKMDVACSATNTQNDTVSRIIFQNNYNNWQEITLASNAGDGIAVFEYNGRPNIVGVTGTQLSWFANPGGSAARTASNWVTHYIGDGNIGTSLTTLNVGNREIVLEASNEQLWSSGLAYFDPGSNPYGSWSKVIIDSTYRDSHELAADNLNGVPFFVTGEQSQASSACNPDGYNDHPSISGCRSEIFPWTGNGFGTRTLLTNSGTQNQTLFQVNGTEYMLGANHGHFDDYDKPLYLWTFTSVTGGGGGGGGGQPLANGTYLFKDGRGHVWDAGFSNPAGANQPFIFEYGENDNTWQQFVWGNGQLKVVANGAYVFNSGNTLGVGSTAGAFNIVSSGSGYTIQDKSSGLYVNSNGADSPPNKLALSSTPTIWTAVPFGQTQPQTLANGTYLFKDGRGHVWDAGFSNPAGANQPFIFEYGQNNNPWQQFVWSNSELKVVANGAYVFNSNNTLGVGSTVGTFNIVSNGVGYTIQDKSSGLYVNSNGSDSPPNKLGLSSSPTTWTPVAM